MPDVLNRMHVATPAPRDTVARPACIPAGVNEARKRREAGERKPTEKDAQVTLYSVWLRNCRPPTVGGAERKRFLILQEEAGGGGVYSMDMNKLYRLEDDSWKYDIIPEIMDGHNIADFVDPDIDAR